MPPKENKKAKQINNNLFQVIKKAKQINNDLVISVT